MTGYLQESATLEESDLAIVHALQIDPRASWVRIGKALDVDPVTAARRFARLRASGSAWLACHPAGEIELALTEIHCRDGQTARVAAELARDPQAATIERTLGGRGLIVTVATRSPEGLTRYLMDRLDTVAGVRDIRSHLCATAYTDASRWRLNVLDRAQLARLGEGQKSATPPLPATVDLTEADRRIARALEADARMPVAELARATGLSEASARRRTERLLASRRLVLRCELSCQSTPTPVQVWLFGDVPAPHLEAAAAQLSRRAETRVVFSLTGTHRLAVAVWVRSLGHLQEFEAQVERAVPGLNFRERSVVGYPLKRLGWLFDDVGRPIGHVPLGL